MRVLVFGIHGVTKDIYTFGWALVLYFKSHVDFHVCQLPSAQCTPSQAQWGLGLDVGAWCCVSCAWECVRVCVCGWVCEWASEVGAISAQPEPRAALLRACSSCCHCHHDVTLTQTAAKTDLTHLVKFERFLEMNMDSDFFSYLRFIIVFWL